MHPITAMLKVGSYCSVQQLHLPAAVIQPRRTPAHSPNNVPMVSKHGKPAGMAPHRSVLLCSCRHLSLDSVAHDEGIALCNWLPYTLKVSRLLTILGASGRGPDMLQLLASNTRKDMLRRSVHKQWTVIIQLAADPHHHAKTLNCGCGLVKV